MKVHPDDMRSQFLLHPIGLGLKVIKIQTFHTHTALFVASKWFNIQNT
jgi:hypothetical protein